MGPFLTPPGLGGLEQESVELPDQGPRGASPLRGRRGASCRNPRIQADWGIQSSELKDPQGSSHPPHIRSWNHYP